MATWCLSTGQSPDTYMGLSYAAREAFLREAKRMGIVKFKDKG